MSIFIPVSFVAPYKINVSMKRFKNDPFLQDYGFPVSCQLLSDSEGKFSDRF